MSSKNKIKRTKPKLFSLRALGVGQEVSDNEYIQRQLQKQNEKDSYDDMYGDGADVPNSTQIVIENRLWKYFKRKIQLYGKKVQKERVNGWQKLMQTIIKEADKKINHNKYLLQELNKLVKEKYKQTHECYKEIELLKRQRMSQNQILDGTQNQIQKKQLIRQNIQGINKQIEEVCAHAKKIEVEVQKISKEKKSFLMCLLKEGFYKRNGCIWILFQLKNIQCRPTHQDFPSFLDRRSIQYLLTLYDSNHQPAFLSTKSKFLRDPNPYGDTIHTQRNYNKKNKSVSDIGELARHSHLKDIYAGTQKYLVEWVKKQRAKSPIMKETIIKFPKLNKSKLTEYSFSQDKYEEYRAREEKKRITNAYPQQIKEKVKKLSFGIRMQE